MTDGPVEINQNDITDFIFDKLIEQGAAVSKDNINLILDLEMLYLQHIGVAG